jgi:transposase-like protein
MEGSLFRGFCLPSTSRFLISYLQFIQEAEAKRLEEAATKLRNQRLEADGRKKEREVKFTDRVPPPKRARTTSACMLVFLSLSWYNTDVW